MNENKKESPYRREVNQYFHMLFGLFNAFVMGFMLWLAQVNIILVILGYISILFMVIGIIITFIINNPFYKYYTLGTFACGSIYAIPGLFMIPTTNFSYGFIDYIIFGITIPEIYFIVVLLKDSTFLEAYGKQALARERGQYDSSLHYALMDPRVLEAQHKHTIESELKELEMKREYNKKHKSALFKTVSIISILTFLVIYFSGTTG